MPCPSVRRAVARLAAAGLLGALAGCATTPTDDAYAGPRPGVLTGSVGYRQRIVLSPEAQLVVRIVETARDGAAAGVVAERRYPHPGQVPIRFELRYDPPGVDARRRYQVQARIEDRGRTLFANHLAYPVLTQGAPQHVDMILDVARAGQP